MTDLFKANDNVLNNNLILQHLQKVAELIGAGEQPKPLAPHPMIMRTKDCLFVKRLIREVGENHWCTYEQLAIFMKTGKPTVVNLLSRARNDDEYTVESRPYQGHSKMYRIRKIA